MPGTLAFAQDKHTRNAIWDYRLGRRGGAGDDDAITPASRRVSERVAPLRRYACASSNSAVSAFFTDTPAFITKHSWGYAGRYPTIRSSSEALRFCPGYAIMAGRFAMPQLTSPILG
jgi:hypothetical protein